MQKDYILTYYTFNNRILRFLIFLAFFIVFFLYHRTVIYDRLGLLFAANTLILIIFITSIYKIKIGLYIFIFFIPLLNSLTIIFSVRSMNVILFLFLSLFLGFLVNKSESDKNMLNMYKFNLHYEQEVMLAIFIFIFITLISSLITIYRYSNFLPFLSTRYHDLTVNINGIGSTSSILWTIKFFFNYVIGFGLFFIIFNAFKNIKDIVKAVIIIIVSNTVFFLVGYYQYFFNPTFGNFSQWVEAYRINATFTDPNSLGNYIIILFPIYVALIIYYKKWYFKLLFFFLLANFLLIAMLSGSRNAFLGIILALIIFGLIGLVKLVKMLVRKSRESRKVRRFSIALASIALIIIIVFVSCFTILMVSRVELKDKYRLPETNISLIDRTVDTIWMSYNVYRQAGFIEAFKSVSSERHVIWVQAIDMFRDYKITGVGLGGFWIELPNYYQINDSQVRIIDFTGNYYLQILSEMGLAGLLSLLLIFFFIIKKVILYYKNGKMVHREERADWLLTGFFVSFISMIVLLFLGPHTNFNEIQLAFWLITGSMVTYIKANEAGLDPGRFKDYKNSLKIVKNIRLSLEQKISIILIIIIFTASFFVSSWTGLSMNVRQNLVGWDGGYGFYHQEVIEDRNIRWTDIDASMVIENKGSGLVVPVKDSDPAGHLLPLFIRFFIDNKLVKVVRIDDKRWHEIEIDLSGFQEERLTFTISCSRSWTPKERGLSEDSRELGVMTGEFKYLE